MIEAKIDRNFVEHEKDLWLNSLHGKFIGKKNAEAWRKTLHKITIFINLARDLFD